MLALSSDQEVATSAADMAGSRQDPVLQVAGPRQQLHRPPRRGAALRAHRRSACACSATATSASAPTASCSIGPQRRATTASRCASSTRTAAKPRCAATACAWSRASCRWRARITGDRVVLETGAGEIVPRFGEGCDSHGRHGHRALRRREARRLRRRRRRARSCTPPDAASMFTFVDVGNPHAVIQSPWPLELVPLHEVGPVIEEHQYFPRKANVEFVGPSTRHDAKVRVWERGVGETRACGTGATATAVALVRSGPLREPGDRGAAGRQARGRGRAGLARVHDRARRRDLPRRPLARVPGAPR